MARTAEDKVYLGKSVLEAARGRISYLFDRFPRVYMSGPSGKDSGVLMHLMGEEARKRGRRFGVLYIDLEAQYSLTIQWVERMFATYADVVDPYWLCLPVALRNAASQFNPKWCAWDPTPGVEWVRKPPKIAITNANNFSWFRMPEIGPNSGETAMEFEEIVPLFGEWYSQGKLTGCAVGIRSDESLNRWRAVTGDSSRFIDPDTQRKLPWTTYKGGTVFNTYPIYDWKTEDVWRYYGREKKDYNKIYDLMHRAGVGIHQQRICQPYGDDQRKGLWLFHLLEPQTWSRIVCRVSGANQGALYARERGSILGNYTVSKPEQYTWKEYSQILVESLPPQSKQRMEDKIAVFVNWWATRGYARGIPDTADPKLESAKKAPSWRRVCKMLLKNDYWAKSLSFGPTKSESYERYRKVMEKRRQRWANNFSTK